MEVHNMLILLSLSQEIGIHVHFIHMISIVDLIGIIDYLFHVVM